MMSVGEEYEIKNGLKGILRDVILKLIFCVVDENQKIKAIIGICGSQLIWRQSWHFKNIILVKVRSTMLINPCGGYLLVTLPIGEQCCFNEMVSRTIFIKESMTNGIFRWNFKISYGLKGSSIRVGAAPTDLLSQCEMKLLGDVNGTCAFWFFRNNDGRMQSSLCGESMIRNRRPDNSYVSSDDELFVPDEAVVAMELDTGAAQLSFFINQTKVPHGFHSLYKPTHLGVSGLGGPSFVTLSLRRLRVPTPCTVECIYHQCERKKEEQVRWGKKQH